MIRPHHAPHLRRALRAIAFGGVALAAISCNSTTETRGYSGIFITGGDFQSAPKATLLPNPLIVHVIGTGNIGVAGIPVTFSITSGGGSVLPTTATTDADGFAQTRWTLGPAAGSQQASATVAGLPAVTFDATATP
ncbi:MAG: hypothetical protein M3081_07570 [Gemmatimonadota bacterium]|nr:hypothetical protein [Gemmatimonadota bacterium]